MWGSRFGAYKATFAKRTFQHVGCMRPAFWSTDVFFLADQLCRKAQIWEASVTHTISSPTSGSIFMLYKCRQIYYCIYTWMVWVMIYIYNPIIHLLFYTIKIAIIRRPDADVGVWFQDLQSDPQPPLPVRLGVVQLCGCNQYKTGLGRWREFLTRWWFQIIRYVWFSPLCGEMIQFD